MSNLHGKFTYGPARSRFGYFINDGSTASSIKLGAQAITLEADNSNYTYHGRSYGIGASVGIFDAHFAAKQ